MSRRDDGDVVRALLEGALAILPTDTVYGLACRADSRRAAADLYRLKGRSTTQPTSIVLASVAAVEQALPGLDPAIVRVLRRLLPGPYTVVVPDTRASFEWLCGDRPGTIGVRVPALPPGVAEIVARVGAVAATSANLPGGPDPRLLDDVPPRIREGAAVEVDAGELPGVPSTVIDLTSADPVVVRAGAVGADEALARVASSHTESLLVGDDALT
jgi:L-threonylcarbamoyladenylate synthase